MVSASRLATLSAFDQVDGQVQAPGPQLAAHPRGRPLNGGLATRIRFVRFARAGGRTLPHPSEPLRHHRGPRPVFLVTRVDGHPARRGGGGGPADRYACAAVSPIADTDVVPRIESCPGAARPVTDDQRAGAVRSLSLRHPAGRRAGTDRIGAQEIAADAGVALARLYRYYPPSTMFAMVPTEQVSWFRLPPPTGDVRSPTSPRSWSLRAETVAAGSATQHAMITRPRSCARANARRPDAA